MFKLKPSVTWGLSGLVRIAFLPLLALLVVPFFLVGQNVHAQSTGFSSVYIEPVPVGGPNYKSSSSTFWINVTTNLAAADTINSFDIILNYSNTVAIKAQPSIDFIGNIFDGKGGSVYAECVDGVDEIGGGCSGIGVGSIHFAETIVGGDTVSGIQGVLLFRVQFQVQGDGTSVFSLGRANLINPYGTGNPSVIDTISIHLVALEGVFSNTGLVAFFNYIPSYSPAVLPGEKIFFDASGSFNASSSSDGIASYSWDFGDGAPVVTGSSSTVSYAFSSPGTYQVMLNVTSSVGDHVASTSRSVVVVPAMGQLVLHLAESKDRSLPAKIQVQIFTSASSAFPFEMQTSNSSNVVVFQNLQPGSYLLKFSNSGIQDHSDNAIVYAGLTTTHTVYLDLIPVPPPPANYGYLFYLVPVIGGLGIISVLMLRKARSNRDGPRERSSRRGSAR